jgi:hypothetical protein
MLEVLASESGSPVARWEGLTLASTRRPEVEAQKWADQVAEPVSKCPHIILLGLGCGYHVFELRRRLPDKEIFVIEARAELIQFCLKNFSMEMSRLEILEVESLEKLWGSARMHKAFSQPYALLEHRPSLQPCRALYKEIAALIRGRERAFFRESLELRPARKLLFEEKKLLADLSGEEKAHQLVSVKDLEDWLSDEQRWTRSGCLLQALRELVK